MIAGDAKRQMPTPAGAVNAFYCAGGPQDGITPQHRRQLAGLRWGRPCTSPSLPGLLGRQAPGQPEPQEPCRVRRRGHMPGRFPVPIPAVTFRSHYPTSGTTAGFRLSSGMASSMHGDAFFAWDNDTMAERVKNCVVQKIQCDTFGNP